MGAAERERRHVAAHGGGSARRNDAPKAAWPRSDRTTASTDRNDADAAARRAADGSSSLAALVAGVGASPSDVTESSCADGSGTFAQRSDRCQRKKVTSWGAGVAAPPSLPSATLEAGSGVLPGAASSLSDFAAAAGAYSSTQANLSASSAPTPRGAGATVAAEAAVGGRTMPVCRATASAVMGASPVIMTTRCNDCCSSRTVRTVSVLSGDARTRKPQKEKSASATPRGRVRQRRRTKDVLTAPVLPATLPRVGA